MKILIIDDYESYGESLVDLFDTLGHEAQYASSYSEAEWLLDLFPFELALLDFDMPAMTGPSIAQIITQRYPQIYAVIMSSHVPDPARRKEIGDWTFLQKPLSQQILQKLLSELTHQRTGFGIVRRASFPILRIEAPDGGHCNEDHCNENHQGQGQDEDEDNAHPFG